MGLTLLSHLFGSGARALKMLYYGTVMRLRVTGSVQGLATRRRDRSWLGLALVHGLPAVLFLYGVKCILAEEGTLTVGSRIVMGSFRLVKVQGTPALLTGLGYIAAAVFVALCTGDPPPESRSWLWGVLRAVARWGGLFGMFWFWVRAGQLVGAIRSWPEFRLAENLLLVRGLGICFGIVAVLALLWAMFQREAVKRDLCDHGCLPLHIWWRPAAYWAPSLAGGTGFRVVYRDSTRALHKAYCAVYLSCRESPNWGSRRVSWLRDEVVRPEPGTDSWVVVDDVPTRKKLRQAPAASDNLLPP